MKLKNAGIKSKKEWATRMTNGEIFYYDENKIYFDESKLNPFLVCGVSTGSASAPLDGLWGAFAEIEIEYRWEDELKNGPVLCWVSDNDPNAKYRVNLIVSERPFNNKYNYKDNGGEDWIYATPIQPSDCLSLED